MLSHLKIVAQIFSEPGEVPAKLSFSRIFTAIWILSSIAWISIYLAVEHKLPEGPTIFGIGSVVTSLYAANKIANAIGS